MWASFEDLRFIVFCLFVVEEDSNRRGVVVIVLPGADSPEKCPQKSNGHYKTNTDQKENDVHLTLF